MPKKKSNYYLRQLRGKDERYTQEDYQELLEHEGEFRYSDFKKWNMAKLWRTARVLRDEAFNRADEFDKAVAEEGIALSPAYSRLEERNITWIKDRLRLKFGAKKIELINNIIQTLTFLDDETSTVEGWKKVIRGLAAQVEQKSKRTMTDDEREDFFRRLIDKDESQNFYDLYYKVTDYLTKNAIIWKPSETMSEIQYATSLDRFKYQDWNNEGVVDEISKFIKERLQSAYEAQKQLEREQTNAAYRTTKK